MISRTRANRAPAAPGSLSAALWTVLLLSACGGEGERRPDATGVPERRGASLVVGTSMERFALLVVPRRGGAVTLRALEAPEDSLWSGAASLPAAVDARSMGSVAVLVDSAGRVYRYDPARDALAEVGRVANGAAWVGTDGRGVYRAGDRVLAVGPDASRTLVLERPALWAGPAAEDRVAVLAGGEGPPLRLYARGAEEPEAEASPEVRPPALVTAWGTRLAFRSSASPALELWTVPGLEQESRWTLPAPPSVLAASPSSHRLYAGLEGDPRLLSIRRFDGRIDEIAELDAPVVALRPTLFGGGLLASTGATVWYLPREGVEPRRLPTEWREDLPLGLPGDRVLVVRDGEVRLWSREESEARPLEASADAWWLPVRWRPVRTPALAARSAGRVGPGDESGGAAAGEGEGVPEAARVGGETGRERDEGEPGGGAAATANPGREVREGRRAGGPSSSAATRPSSSPPKSASTSSSSAT